MCNTFKLIIMITTKTITRPANTTTYSIGDVMANGADVAPIEIEFPTAGNGLVTVGGSLISSNESGTPSIDVLFYSNTFTVAGDNAAFAPTDANSALYLGRNSFTAWNAYASNKVSDAKPTKPIGLQDCGNTTLVKIYAVLVMASTYTPISAEQITIKLDII
jgi:hypothetical protein